MLTYSSALIDHDGNMRVAAVTPLTDDQPLRITNARLSHSTLEHVNITADHIVTESLTATEPVTFAKELNVGGSIVAQGSVIGSGPYFDSSDGRFKRGMSSIPNALDRVLAMNGVRKVGENTV